MPAESQDVEGSLESHRSCDGRNTRTTSHAGAGFGKAHYMIELHKHLKLFTFPGTKRTTLLLG